MRLAIEFQNTAGTEVDFEFDETQPQALLRDLAAWALQHTPAWADGKHGFGCSRSVRADLVAHGSYTAADGKVTSIEVCPRWFLCTREFISTGCVPCSPLRPTRCSSMRASLTSGCRLTVAYAAPSPGELRAPSVIGS